MSTDLFDQYATLDPAETPEALPDWTSTAPVLLAEIDERTHLMQTKYRPNTSTEPKRRWTGVLVAAAAFAIVLIVGVSIVLAGRGGDSFDTVAPVTTTAAVTATAIAPSTVGVVPEAWDPILSTTMAKAAPPAATCPAGTNPNAPGPADQGRPAPGWVSNQAGAFDRHTGRIVYVDVAGETWTFDVCTSTWQKMDPVGAPISDEDRYDLANDPSRILGELVYDIDSDRTIAFGARSLGVYDANANTWTQKSYPSKLGFDGNGDYNPVGAVYDPMSGLIITGNTGDVSAYDVDTDQWIFVGSAREEGEGPYAFLVGYSPATDQLVFQAYVGKGPDYGSRGVVVDLRNGEQTAVSGQGANGKGVFGWFAYATDTDTAYIRTERQGICEFDPIALDWDTCLPRSDSLNPRFALHTAMVGDPINNRLILIHGSGGEWSSLGEDDVWAIALDTGEWTQLLAPSSP